MIELPDRTVLIGVDAGATEVKAHQVTLLSPSSRDPLRIGPAGASCCYDRVPGFEPVPLERQLEQRGAPELEPRELEQGERWVDAAASSILAIAAQARRPRALIGIGLPGLKTPDGRGLCVVRNGPRIPAYAALLERRLEQRGLELVRPVGPLTSDGDNCGRGEETDRQGLFRGVANAYYVGGGTGVAEALKLDGRLVGFDDVRGWLDKAWELRSGGGGRFEDALSTRGINAIYAKDSGRPMPIGRDEYPEERALTGDVVAEGVLKEAAHALAELIFERLVTLRHGPRPYAVSGPASAPRPTARPGSHGDSAKRDPALPRPSPAIASLRGTVLDRVVIGQRLGRIFGDARYAGVFRAHVEESLARRLQRSSYARLRGAHLVRERLRPGFLRASRQRSAPALGAAAAALGAPVLSVAPVPHGEPGS